MSYFPKDDAEYAASKAYTYARELLNITQHVLDDSLDFHTIMKMSENMAGMEEAVAMLKGWIKTVQAEKDDNGAE